MLVIFSLIHVVKYKDIGYFDGIEISTVVP